MINFGTAGFRAIIGEDFTKENVQKIAQALCEIIKEKGSKKPVVLGYDYRFLSENAAEWIAEVLAGNKIKTLLTRTAVPTPVVMYASKTMDNDYGAMITASHNPYLYNGVKIFIDEGKDADKEFTNALEGKIALNTEIKTCPVEKALTENLVEYLDGIEDYVDAICRIVDITKGHNTKILFNTMHGSGVKAIHLLKDKLGLTNFDVVNENRDAFFGFELPAPTAANLGGFAKQVVDGGYAFGAATDGDGDRLAVIDEKGNFHDANTILTILYYYFIKYKKLEGDIVKNLSTSISVDRLAKKLGYTCHETAVGFKSITEGMKKSNALIGGESSGGVALRGFIYGKDGIFVTALLTEMLTTIDKPFSAIVKEVYDYVGYDYKFREVTAPIKDKAKLIAALNKTMPTFEKKVVKKYDYDGFKYVLEDDSWVLIRFSGTEPIIRLTTEQPTLQEVEKYIQCAKDFVKNIEEN